MGLFTLIQHFVVTPDLNNLGRSADFLAEAASFGVRQQVRSLTQLYGVLEAVKLAIGGALASYFFGMESTVRRSKSRRTRASDEPLSLSVK
jgi:hypothetical protein